MIAAAVEQLTPIIGTRPACRAVGASRRRSIVVAARRSTRRPALFLIGREGYRRAGERLGLPGETVRD
jgi:hypothetical protein